MHCSRELWQNRHLSEQRLLLSEEGRNSGSSGTQQWSISQCLHISWRRGGREKVEDQGTHSAATPIISGILCWFLQLCLSPSFLFFPFMLLCSACLWLVLKEYSYKRKAWKWMTICSCLFNGSDIWTSRGGPKKHSSCWVSRIQLYTYLLHQIQWKNAYGIIWEVAVQKGLSFSFHPTITSRLTFFG